MGRIAVALAVILSVSGCSRGKRYELEGQVLAVDTSRQQITVKHGDIRGFMPGMTMPFRVVDGSLQERKPGELIKATLVVTGSTGALENIVRTGEAPLPPDAGPHHSAAGALEPGAPVADAAFVDQTGRERRLSEWRGKTLAVTFVYTRCPLPDFCPLMDRNFAAVQKSLLSDKGRGAIHLLSVSFDPRYDSPQVLAAHAKKARSRPDTWTWLTGEQNAVDAFAAQFGVSIIRDDRPMQEITHNLRTIVIDRAGRVVKIYNGNDWKTEELLATLRAADAS